MCDLLPGIYYSTTEMNPVDIDSRVPHYRFQLEEATRKNILALSKREELSTEEDHFIL